MRKILDELGVIDFMETCCNTQNAAENASDVAAAPDGQQGN